MSTRYVDQRKT